MRRHLLHILHFRFEAIDKFLCVPIILLREFVPCRWAVYATLQSVFRHRNSIGALVGLQFQACHNIIGTQPYGVSRLLAVASLRLFLTFPALALSLYDGNKRYVYVRSFLAPMKVRRCPFRAG